MKNKIAFFLLSIFLFSCGKTEVPEIIVPPVQPGVANATFVSMSKSSGVVGDVLTLTGTGFSTVISENQVNFTGTTTSAVIKSATATLLTVEVPVGSTTGIVSIKVKNVAAVKPAGFSGEFTISAVVTPPTGNGTLLLIETVKTHEFFSANDGEGNFFTIKTDGPSHSFYKVVKMNSTGTVIKTFEPADFGGTTGVNLAINGITNDFDGNVYVAVGFSTSTYRRSDGRLYMIAKASEKPVLVMNITGNGLAGLDVPDYFTDMVVNSKKELFVSDENRIYHVPTTGVIANYIADTKDINDTKFFIQFGGLTIDKNDNLYFTAANGVASLNNIFKVSSTKTITKLYTSAETGFADGPLATAKFGTLGSITVNGAGTQLYIADSRNYRLRKLDLTTNVVSAIAGTGNPIGFSIVNGAAVLNANGPALQSTTQPTKISVSEKQKTIYMQLLTNAWYQVYKY